MAKVLIATPTSGGLHERVCAWREFISHRYRDRVKFADINDLYIIAQGRPVDFVRNGLIRIFLAADFTHLFLLDSDTEPPLDAIERLLALNAPLASGCYPVLMHEGLRWALLNAGTDRLYRLLERLPSQDLPFVVDAGGAGCLLIRRDVFSKVKWPWFKWFEREDGTQESEDIFFFRKCNEAGLKVTVDPSVICNHFKTINITDLMRMVMAKQKKKG